MVNSIGGSRVGSLQLSDNTAAVASTSALVTAMQPPTNSETMITSSAALTSDSVQQLRRKKRITEEIHNILNGKIKTDGNIIEPILSVVKLGIPLDVVMPDKVTKENKNNIRKILDYIGLRFFYCADATDNEVGFLFKNVVYFLKNIDDQRRGHDRENYFSPEIFRLLSERKQKVKPPAGGEYLAFAQNQLEIFSKYRDELERHFNQPRSGAPLLPPVEKCNIKIDPEKINKPFVDKVFMPQLAAEGLDKMCDEIIKYNKEFDLLKNNASECSGEIIKILQRIDNVLDGINLYLMICAEQTVRLGHYLRGVSKSGQFIKRQEREYADYGIKLIIPRLNNERPFRVDGKEYDLVSLLRLAELPDSLIKSVQRTEDVIKEFYFPFE